MAGTAALVYNPAAGRGQGKLLAHRASRVLGEHGWRTEPRATRGPGDATRLAREAAEVGAEAIFSLGGDGTLRECAAGVLGTATAVGFLPCGTANVMTKPLGLADDPTAAARQLANAKSVEFDVGLCGDRPFLMQASTGVDTATLDRMRPFVKRRLGRGAVVAAAVGAWCGYRFPRFDVRWGGEKRTVSFAAVCNIPFYGGGWRLAPDARWNDRLLDLVLFSGGRWQTLLFALDLLRGRHAKRRDVEFARAERFDLRPPSRIQVDGDVYPENQWLTVCIADRRLRLLCAEALDESETDRVIPCPIP